MTCRMLTCKPGLAGPRPRKKGSVAAAQVCRLAWSGYQPELSGSPKKK